MRMDEAFKHLKHGFESGRLAQAYIVAGTQRLEGQAFVERALELVYCTTAEKEKPCGHCRACTQVKYHSHPDILWIEPEKKSRKISIDQVRKIQRLIFQTSFFGGWKACVLVGADRLGSEASNAFLKTLEEPPGKSIFFLLTDSPQFLLPTIVSRCQRINVSSERVSLADDWRKRILGVLTDDGAARTSMTGIACQQGRLHNAVTAFARADKLVRLLKEVKETIEMEETEMASAMASDEKEEIRDARINARYREVRTSIMRFILLWYRDILLLLCGGDDAFVLNDDYLDLMKKKTKGLTLRQALRNIQVVEAMNSQLERNITEAPVFGFGFCSLAC